MSESSVTKSPSLLMQAMHFNGMSLAKIERMIMLGEEFGEGTQAVAKLLRHGAYSFHPDDPAKIPNIELLRRELIDIFTMAQVLIDMGDMKPITQEEIKAARQKKRAFTHHQQASYW